MLSTLHGNTERLIHNIRNLSLSLSLSPFSSVYLREGAHLHSDPRDLFIPSHSVNAQRYFFLSLSLSPSAHPTSSPWYSYVTVSFFFLLSNECLHDTNDRRTNSSAALPPNTTECEEEESSQEGRETRRRRRREREREREKAKCIPDVAGVISLTQMNLYLVE